MTGFETWSFSIEAGRGIGMHEKRARDDTIRRWPSNEPPEPEWDKLNFNYLLQDDLPREPADNEPMFAITFGSLEFTDHQKKMLEPPEKRLSELRFPKSFEDRVRRQRRGDKRRSKWGEQAPRHLYGQFIETVVEASTSRRGSRT